MYPSTIRVVQFLLTISLLATVRADCYWSDGTENDSHQPCYSSQGGAVGLCCANGDICTSSGVCMQASQSSGQGMSNSGSSAYYRGSCMFKDWSQGKNCPTVCLKGPGTSLHATVEMIPCPGSGGTDWYCADGNMKKANCSSGAYIVSLAKPSILTTIGVSPSMSGSPKPTSPPTALGPRPDSSTTAPAPETTANSTAPAEPGETSGTGSAPPASSTPSPTTEEPAPSDSGSVLPSPPPPEESSAPDNSSAVPLAVGVSIGGASLIGAGVLGYFLWRRRRDSSSSLARAETPPPRGSPDDDYMNPILTAPLFRTGSLIRRPNSDYLNTIGRTGPTSPEAVTATAVLSGDRTNSMRTNSMMSNMNSHHHVRSVSQDRFGPDVVAMHDMRRTPPAGWGYPRGRNEPTETIPEIPYDGRRLPPYHGTPVLENNGFYSELPG